MSDRKKSGLSAGGSLEGIPSTANRFRDNVLSLCDLAIDLIALAESAKIQTDLNSLMMEFAKGMISSSNAEEMITGFIQRSFAYWDSILAKDEKFITENAGVLFKELSIDHVKSFSALYTAKTTRGQDLVPSDKKGEIWAVVHGMVKQSIRFIHERREWGPNKDPKTAKEKPVAYNVEFFPDVKISMQVTKWNVKL